MISKTPDQITGDETWQELRDIYEAKVAALEKQLAERPAPSPYECYWSVRALAAEKRVEELEQRLNDVTCRQD